VYEVLLSRARDKPYTGICMKLHDCCCNHTSLICVWNHIVVVRSKIFPETLQTCTLLVQWFHIFLYLWSTFIQLHCLKLRSGLHSLKASKCDNVLKLIFNVSCQYFTFGGTLVVLLLWRKVLCWVFYMLCHCFGLTILLLFIICNNIEAQISSTNRWR